MQAFSAWPVGAWAPLTLAVLIVVVGLVARLRRQRRSRRRPAASVEYRPAQALLNDAERALYHCLRRAVGDHYAVLPKVRLAELVAVGGGRPRARRAARVDLRRRHVDFLLCCKETFVPVAVVQLDSPRRRVGARDPVAATLAQAGIPLVRLGACKSPDPLAVYAAITAAVSPPAKAAPHPAAPNWDQQRVALR